MQLQGEIKAQLGGIVGKLADVGGSGKGSITKEEFEGLTQEATAAALEGDRGCRERLFDKTFDKLSKPSRESDSETHGWLLPANDPTPSNGCSQQIAAGTIAADPLLLVGRIAYAVPSMSGNKFTALKMRNCRIVSMAKGSSGIKVDADHYGTDGKLIFRIRNNEFHVMPQRISYSELSQDHSMITVYDVHGEELLVVHYANPGTVQVRGTFGCTGHDLVKITDDKITDSQGGISTYGNLCMSGYFTEAAIGIR